MAGHIILAFITFVVTNLDDIVILTFYFASRRYHARTIVAGQYLGISTLIAVSLLGILFNAFLSLKWIALLGIFPILLGLKELLSAKEGNGDELTSAEKVSRVGIIQVAGVTVANGGDNIAVYAPLFASISRPYLAFYITIFLILTAFWCFLGSYLVAHPVLQKVIHVYGKKIFPWFLILLGAFILKDFFF